MPTLIVIHSHQATVDVHDLILSQIQDGKRTTLSEIQALCPETPRETVKTALSTLTADGKLKKNLHGKDTYYTEETTSPITTFTALQKGSKLDEAFRLLKPENENELRIVSDPEWREGASYGKPRPGHPEGEIVYHVLEVLENVDTWCKEHNSTASERAKLRVIAMIHDTFKMKVNRDLPKTGNNHHALIARRFAEQIAITDKEILEIIEHHDDAYNAWGKGKNGNWVEADQKVERLKTTLESQNVSLELYNAFYWCDSNTGDKDPAPYAWFQKFVKINSAIV